VLPYVLYSSISTSSPFVASCSTLRPSLFGVPSAGHDHQGISDKRDGEDRTQMQGQKLTMQEEMWDIV
jgi:hypothetical protein